MMQILYTILFILLGGFFAGSETAFISIDRLNLHSHLDSKDKRYKILGKLILHPEDMLGMFLVGTNVCMVSATIIFTDYMVHHLNGSALIPLYVTLIMTPLVLVFTDVLPKIIFREYADQIMHGLAYVYLFFYIALFPVQFAFVRSIKFVLSILGLRKRKKEVFSRDEFKLLLDISSTQGALKQKERDFIESIMNFRNVTTREIMIPLNRLICIEENEEIARAADLMLTSRHSRLPVYRSRVDNIVGYIQNKDIIYADKNEPVKKYVRDTIYIPEYALIDRVLVEMQENFAQMVFTVDEYGGISGVITTQDLITEIVGEFIERGETEIKRNADDFEVKGMLDIDELEEELNIKIDKYGFETVSGFIMYKMEKIPEVGDKFDYGKYTFEVIKTNRFRIDKVKIYPRSKNRKNGKISKNGAS